MPSRSGFGRTAIALVLAGFLASLCAGQWDQSRTRERPAKAAARRSPAAPTPAPRRPENRLPPWPTSIVARRSPGSRLAPGGGYDIWARLIARYLGRHVPGNPTVVWRTAGGRQPAAPT